MSVEISDHDYSYVHLKRTLFSLASVCSLNWTNYCTLFIVNTADSVITRAGKAETRQKLDLGSLISHQVGGVNVVVSYENMARGKCDKDKASESLID